MNSNSVILRVQSPLVIDLLTGGLPENESETHIHQIGGDINVNTSKGVVTTSAINWLDPYKHPPQIGKIQLLSWDNIQSSGTWGADGHLHYAAWAPLASRPNWLKERMWAKYKGEFTPKPVSS